MSSVGERWQRQAGIGVASIAVRHLVQVLLVVILGQEVGEVAGRCDFRSDVGKPAIFDDLCVRIPCHLGEFALRLSGVEDRTAVLGADVVALTKALRWIVVLPKDPQDLVGGDLGGSVSDEDSLGMPRHACAHLLVGRMGCYPTHVAHGRPDHSGQAPVDLLSAPEAAHREVDLFDVISWWMHRRTEHRVLVGNGEGRPLTTREGGIGIDHLRLGVESEHAPRLNAMDGFNTRAIHAGQEPDPLTGAVVPPIYQVSTYAQDGVGGLRGGYEYSRSANPTRTALQECLAALEAPEDPNGRGLAFASGLAAEDTLMRTVLAPGTHAVIPDDAYGGTYRLFAKVAAPWGVEHTPASVTDPAAIAAAIQPGRTRLVWIETPTNPLLNVADIAAISEIAHSAGALLVVDNTFASSYLQQPLLLGADVVVHSTTKYLGGHSDVIGGALVVRDLELAERLAFHQNSMGAVPGPLDSWLVLRGIKTLGVRMDRHSANARAVVDFLSEHSAVSQVLYPGLESHPGHEVASRQMRDFGGMVSFRAAGGEQAAVDLCARTEVFTLGESLGGVESLIEHPGRMTHASAAGSPLEVPADLVRLSVGIEDVEDLIADLDKALR